MQNFAINGGLLNGDPEVWIDDTSLSVAVQAAGGVMLGRALTGTAQVVASTSLPLALMAKLQGSASAQLFAGGSLTYGVSLVGATLVQVKSTGDLLRWGMIVGAAPTVVSAEGDIAVVPAISASFDVIFGADLDLHVGTGHKIEGVAPVVLLPKFQAYSVPATLLSGLAPIQAAGIGRGNLVIASPPGAAPITFKAHGAARFGAKLSLEGSAAIQLYARGYAESWHYVFAEASASIEILARAEKHGIPIIPGYYVEAPVMRAMRVSEEARRFTVPAERRL